MPKFLSHIDLQKNKLLNAVVDPKPNDPSTGLTASDAGLLYFNTGSNILKVYTGSAWKSVGADVSLQSATDIGSTTTNALRISNLGNASDTTPALKIDGGLYIGKDLRVIGNLQVDGTVFTINSSTVKVEDKNLELGNLVSQTYSATLTAGIATVTLTQGTTDGLVVGQPLTKTGGAGAFGASPTIATITNTTTFTVNVNHATSGAIDFTVGATDAFANGGGLTLHGTTDKTILWDSTYYSWTSSENWNIASTKSLRVNNKLKADENFLYIRDQAQGQYDLRIEYASTSAATSQRRLIFDVKNSDRFITLAGDLTLAGALTTSGAFAVTLTATAATSLTLPTSGTLATTTSNISGTAANVTGTVALANGGSGANLTATNGGIVYSGASALAITAAGTSGQVLTSAGAAAPTWTNQSSLSVGSAGNITAGAAGDLLYQSGAGTTSKLTVGTANYVLTSSGSAPQWTANTGTGNVVRASSPTLTTPDIGVATATSINKVTITAPATGATLTIAEGKTLTVNNSITLAGTDSSTLNIGNGGTLGSAAYTPITDYVPSSGHIKIPCVASSYGLGNITLSGTQTINGIALVAGDRVLITSQISAAENGIYVVAAGAWLRATDADTSLKLINAQVLVIKGTNGNRVYSLRGWATSATLGTSAQTWDVITSIDSKIDLNAGVDGTLGVAKGGTGASLSASNGAIVYSGSSSMALLAAGTAGYLLQTNGASAPSWVNPATLTVSAATTATTAGKATNIAGGAALRIPYQSNTDTTTFVSAPAASTPNQTLVSDGSTISWAKTKYVGTITGTGALASFTLTHGLATQDVVVSIYDSSNNLIITDVTLATANNNDLTVAFGSNVPSGTTYKVVVIS